MTKVRLVLPLEAGEPGTPVAVEASGGPRGTTWTGVAVVGEPTPLPLEPGPYVIRGTPPHGPPLEGTCDVPAEPATVEVRLEPVPGSVTPAPGPVEPVPGSGARGPAAGWGNASPSPASRSFDGPAARFVERLRRTAGDRRPGRTSRPGGEWRVAVVGIRPDGRPRTVVGSRAVPATGTELREVATGASATYVRLTAPVSVYQDDAAPPSTRYVALPPMTRTRPHILPAPPTTVFGGPPEAVVGVRLADPDADALLAHLAAHRPIRAAQIAERLGKRDRAALLNGKDAAPAYLLGYFLLTRRPDPSDDLLRWTADLADHFADLPDALVIHSAALHAQQGPAFNGARALLLRAADPDLGLPRITRGLRLLVSLLEDLVVLDDSRGVVHQPTARAWKRAEDHLLAVDPDQFLVTYDGRGLLAPPGVPREGGPSAVSAAAAGVSPRPFAAYADDALRELPGGEPLAARTAQAGPAIVDMAVHDTERGPRRVVLTVGRVRGGRRRPVADLAIAYGATGGSMLVAVTDGEGHAVFHLPRAEERAPVDATGDSPRRQGFSLAPMREVRHVPLVRVPDPGLALAAHTAQRVRLRRRVGLDGITFDLQEYDDRRTGVRTLRVEAYTAETDSAGANTPGTGTAPATRWASFLARPASRPDAAHELFVIPLVPRDGGPGSGALDMGPSADGLDWYVSPLLTGSAEPDVAERSLARASDPRTARALRAAVPESSTGE
ncbi:hypothetical protein AB0N79_39550 [Streptomyces microflavus]|uniref:hypothetical protein n=1 Tax=Streptomyces microflavus TaxID=1919 RepID=UPI00342AFD43